MKPFECCSTNKVAGGVNRTKVPSGSLPAKQGLTSRLARRAFAGHRVSPGFARENIKPNNEIIGFRFAVRNFPIFVQGTSLPREFPKILPAKLAFDLKKV